MRLHAVELEEASALRDATGGSGRHVQPAGSAAQPGGAGGMMRRSPAPLASALIALSVVRFQGWIRTALACGRSVPHITLHPTDSGGAGGMLRGSPALLTRRAEVSLRALVCVALEEKERALRQAQTATLNYPTLPGTAMQYTTASVVGVSITNAHVCVALEERERALRQAQTTALHYPTKSPLRSIPPVSPPVPPST